MTKIVHGFGTWEKKSRTEIMRGPWLGQIEVQERTTLSSCQLKPYLSKVSGTAHESCHFWLPMCSASRWVLAPYIPRSTVVTSQKHKAGFLGWRWQERKGMHLWSIHNKLDSSKCLCLCHFLALHFQVRHANLPAGVQPAPPGPALTPQFREQLFFLSS